MGNRREECRVKSFLEILSQAHSYTGLTMSQRAQFFRDLLPYVIEPPHVPINESCGPRPLSNPSELQCSVFPRAFTSAPVRATPAKIGVFVKFAFEPDILEAHIREGYDIVDRFFIIEATRSNADHAEKPLVLEHLLRQPRFARMSDKIVHFILDDSVRAGPRFEWENYHELARWERFLVWNNVTKMFGPDDVLIFGDCDEIPSRDIYQYLRYCTLEGPVDIGTWYTNSDVQSQVRTDHPIPQNPFMLGSPTAYTLAQASMVNGYPTRTRGKAGRSVWGGLHLTFYGYLPILVVKLVSITEFQAGPARRQIDDILIGLQQRTSITEIWNRSKRLIGEWTRSRVVEITGEIESNGRVIPWFIKCNPRRYQYFYRTTIHDTRLEPGGVAC
jgi:hypothetical protein